MTVTCIYTLSIQTFHGSLDFIRDNPGEPVPEEAFIHSHQSWSSIIPYLLPPFFAIHGILLVQFKCLTAFFHNLSIKFCLIYLFAWHPQLHTLYISSSNHCLRSTCQYHHNLFCCSTEIMSSNPNSHLCLVPGETLKWKNCIFHMTYYSIARLQLVSSLICSVLLLTTHANSAESCRQ